MRGGTNNCNEIQTACRAYLEKVKLDELVLNQIKKNAYKRKRAENPSVSKPTCRRAAFRQTTGYQAIAVRVHSLHVFSAPKVFSAPSSRIERLHGVTNFVD